MNEQQPIPPIVDGITTFRADSVQSHVGARDYEGPPAPFEQELYGALLPVAVILVGMYFANKYYQRRRFP